MAKAKKYDAETGDRLTDCCGACSTYDEMGVLVCKGCYGEVSPGEGDGTETRKTVKPSIRHRVSGRSGKLKR